MATVELRCSSFDDSVTTIYEQKLPRQSDIIRIDANYKSLTLFFLIQLILSGFPNQVYILIFPVLTRKHLVCCLNKRQREKCQVKSNPLTQSF